jgi:hypothetical protein
MFTIPELTNLWYRMEVFRNGVKTQSTELYETAYWLDPRNANQVLLQSVDVFC